MPPSFVASIAEVLGDAPANRDGAVREHVERMTVRVLFLTIDLQNNSLGRTYCLWLLARKKGWRTTVVAPKGEKIWSPLRNSEFAQDCVVLSDRNESERAELDKLGQAADLIIAVKPLPGSFGRGLHLAETTDTPLLLDIDDPDLEVWLAEHSPLRAIAKAVLRPHYYWAARRMRAMVRGVPCIVSNPTLQARYGGVVVPHVREDAGPGYPHVTRQPSVVFVGTNRPHKGIGLLRKAVADLQPCAISLTITDQAPADAAPWENWVGPSTIEEGIQLVKRGDIVVLPSLPNDAFSPGQLPAKLIDAMLAGRAVAVADTGPMSWAVGDAGVVFPPGSLEGVRRALEYYLAPDVRQMMGDAARARAISMFTPESVLPAFESACRDAMFRREGNLG